MSFVRRINSDKVLHRCADRSALRSSEKLKSYLRKKLSAILKICARIALCIALRYKLDPIFESCSTFSSHSLVKRLQVVSNWNMELKYGFSLFILAFYRCYKLVTFLQIPKES